MHKHIFVHEYIYVNTHAYCRYVRTIIHKQEYTRACTQIYINIKTYMASHVYTIGLHTCTFNFIYGILQELHLFPERSLTRSIIALTPFILAMLESAAPLGRYFEQVL